MPEKRKVENDENDEDVKLAYKKHKSKKFDNSYNEEDMNTIFNDRRQFTGVMRKYWAQRHNIFSKYDGGIILTKELWFSVTPEKISKFVAKYLNDVMSKSVDYSGEGFTILDGFCGGGGNIVQFLDINKNNKVYAIDINTTHLECTQMNASVYCGDVSDRLHILPLDWTHIDAKDTDELNIEPLNATLEESKQTLKTLSSVKFDCVFGSPPWGGPEYIKLDTFDLNNLLPFPLERMLVEMRRYSNTISLFLPKNSDLEQMREVTEKVYKDCHHVHVHIVRMRADRREKGLLVTWVATIDVS